MGRRPTSKRAGFHCSNCGSSGRAGSRSVALTSCIAPPPIDIQHALVAPWNRMLGSASARLRLRSCPGARGPRPRGGGRQRPCHTDVLPDVYSDATTAPTVSASAPTLRAPYERDETIADLQDCIDDYRDAPGAPQRKPKIKYSELDGVVAQVLKDKGRLRQLVDRNGGVSAVAKEGGNPSALPESAAQLHFNAEEVDAVQDRQLARPIGVGDRYGVDAIAREKGTAARRG